VRIDLHPRFQRRVKTLSAADRRLVAGCLRALRDGFGFPHLHSGLGVRRLRQDLFECRAGLHWRIIFLVERGVLTAYDLMTHDQVRTWLRNF
jgi:mRNA-degrading endonuclease RelE of RelBE toxin-antitoxin system